MKTPLQHALELARQGLAVFPVAHDKRPKTPHGFKSATTDPALIHKLERRYSFDLIGIATGEPSGWSALDVDTPDGLPWWTENRHRLPESFAYRTRSGGLHLWFRHLPGLKSSVVRIAPGIDVRAEGASCIWWPAAGFPILSDAPPADWPAWLRPPPKAAPEPPVWRSDDEPRPPERVESALTGLIRNVALAGQGERNARLHWSACRGAEMAARGEISRRNVEAVLIEAASRCGLDHREAAATIASAFRGAR